MGFDNDIQRDLRLFQRSPKTREQQEEIQSYLQSINSGYVKYIQNWLNNRDPVRAYRDFVSEHSLLDDQLQEIAKILRSITDKYVLDVSNPMRQHFAARSEYVPSRSRFSDTAGNSSDSDSDEGDNLLSDRQAKPLTGLSSLNNLNRGVDNTAVGVEAEDKQSNFGPAVSDEVFDEHAVDPENGYPNPLGGFRYLRDLRRTLLDEEDTGLHNGQQNSSRDNLDEGEGDEHAVDLENGHPNPLGGFRYLRDLRKTPLDEDNIGLHNNQKSPRHGDYNTIAVEAGVDDEESDELIRTNSEDRSSETEMSVSGSVASTPVDLDRNKKNYCYINLYPNEKKYNEVWQDLFKERKELLEADIEKLTNGGLTHRSIIDKDFLMQRTAEQAFRASVTGDELKHYPKESHKTITMCCMIDQVVANMIAEGTKLNEICLTLKAPTQDLVDAAYLYARTRYGIVNDRIKIQVAGKEQLASERVQGLAEKGPDELDDTVLSAEKDEVKESIKKMYEKEGNRILNVEHVDEAINFLRSYLDERDNSTASAQSRLEYTRLPKAEQRREVIDNPGKRISNVLSSHEPPSLRRDEKQEESLGPTRPKGGGF